MDFKIRDGFCYTKFIINHPLVEPWRKQCRFSMNPRTLYRLMIDVPELRSHFDFDWYEKWNKHLDDSEYIKGQEKFNLEWDFKIKPYPHQSRAIAFILHTPAQGLFMEPGTGKTFCALVAAEMRLKKGLIKKTLVICPKSVMKTGWYEDLKKFTDLKAIVAHRTVKWKWNCEKCGTRHAGYKAALKHTKKCGAPEPPEETKWHDLKTLENKVNSDDYDLVIASIDTVHRQIDTFRNAGFDSIVLDESTMIKNPSGKRSETIRNLGWSVKYRLAMTGTPITNEIEDIWSQMQFICAPFSPTIGEFRGRYYWYHPVQKFIRGVKKDSGVKIADLTRDYVLRIKKKDCLDLPPRTTKILEVEPSSEVKKVYKKFHADLFAIHEGEKVIAFNTFTEILRLHQIINGYWTNEDEVHRIEKKSPKAMEVKRILESSGGKVIVWIYYKNDVAVLKEVLKKYKPAVVNGATKSVEDEVEKFRDDPECRVMIAHPKSARFGHTWTWANTTIFYTYGYSVEDYWQARERNYRISQEDPVQEIILSYGGIESEILASVIRKDNFSSSVMENFKVMMNKFVV